MILGNPGILGTSRDGLPTHPWGDHPSLVHPGTGCLPILGSSRDAQGETMGNSGLHGHVPAPLDNPRLVPRPCPAISDEELGVAWE